MFVILGATGKIGRATAGALRQRGAEVRAIVRRPDTAGDLAALGCSLSFADIDDHRALLAAFDGAEAVQVICPTSPQAEDAAAEMDRRIAAVAGALAETRPARVLAISDYGAQHAAGTGIALTYHRLEQALRPLDAALVFLRSAEHMQNWRRLARRAVATGVLPSLHHPVSKAFPTVSAPDVGLIAAELLLAGDTRPLSVVHAEGPRRYSAEDVARTLSGLSGRAIAAAALPEDQWLPALTGGGLSASYAGLAAAMYAAHNAGRIEVESEAGETRRGATPLRDVLAAILAGG